MIDIIEAPEQRLEVPADDYEANRLIDELAESRAESQRLLDIADRKLADLEEQIRSIKARQDATEERILGSLRLYMANGPEGKVKETKTQKSYTLLSGKIVVKKPVTRIVWADDALSVVEQAHPDCIRIKKEFDKTKLNKLYKAVGDVVVDESSGEVVEGLTTEITPERYEVKI